MCSCIRWVLLVWFAAAAAAAPVGWLKLADALGLEAGAVTFVEGEAAGFHASAKKVLVRGVRDEMMPRMQIVWQQPLELPVYEVPAGAVVFTRERWTGAPLAAGLKRDGRIVFWTAAPLGERGFERYPYVAQALAEMGLRPRAESRGLWAFFDGSYRLAADADYLAARWRRGGVAGLHVAAWHYWEADAERDAWLKRLIEACHRQAIVVYAWVELPHVSEEFWARHAEWREQTATGQDAKLDWRKLMNLANRECAAEVGRGMDGLMRRFDWDGVNLGELYFESLEGYLNPARFTPFNADVRAEAREKLGFDPAELYEKGSKRYHARDVKPMRRFLDYRAELAARLQEEWLGRLEECRKEKPWLDLALTHIDDRYDPTTRDRLGADAARLLPVAAKHGAAFVVEDPATLWHLGAERYTEMARRYAAVAPDAGALAIDINVVERYQDVYPTKQQTGGELFELVAAAARSFPRVALYFENSILAVDWPLVAAAAVPVRVRWEGGVAEYESGEPVALEWAGCARVNGAEWGVRSAGRLLVPAGKVRVEACESGAGEWLKDFNGRLLGARRSDGRLELKYESRARAIAVMGDGRVLQLEPGRREVSIPLPSVGH